MKKLFTLIVLFTVGQMCSAQVNGKLQAKALKNAEVHQTMNIRHMNQAEGSAQYWVKAMAHFDQYGWFDAASLTPTNNIANVTFNGDEVTFEGLVDVGNFELLQANPIKGHYDQEAKTITISTPEYSPDKGQSDYCVFGTINYLGEAVYLAFLAGQFSETPDIQGQYGLNTVDKLVFDVSDDLATLTPRTGYGCYGFSVISNQQRGFLNFYKSATFMKRPDEARLLVGSEQVHLSGSGVTVGATLKTTVKLSNIGLTETRFKCSYDSKETMVLYGSEYLKPGETADILVEMYPTEAGLFQNQLVFTADNGSTAVVDITAEVGEAPSFSSIVKGGDIIFSFNDDLPFVLTNDITGFPVAVSTNEMESSGKSSILANVRVPEGKIGVLSWRGMSESLHPNGGSQIKLDGAVYFDNVYDFYGEGFKQVPIDGVMVLNAGTHEIQFTNTINMNSYLYGWSEKPFRTYIYDLDFEITDMAEHGAIALDKSVDFGKHYVDKLSTINTATVSLLNVGSEPLRVTAIGTDGPFSGIMTDIASPHAEKCDVVLTFETDQPGNYTGQVVISTTAGDFTIDCAANTEKLPYDYTPIVTGGEFSFDTDITYPFIMADGYAYNSTSKMQITDGKMVSWLQADFIVPEEKVGVLSWTGVNSSANWLNFLGDLTFNDGTRIKIDDSIVREFCGEDPASSTAFASQELVFTPGRHKIRFEYEKILTPPERDDMFRLSNLKLILDTSKIDAVGADDTSVVATSIFSASGEQLGSLRKGVNIIKKTYQDGHVSVSKVIVK